MAGDIKTSDLHIEICNVVGNFNMSFKSKICNISIQYNNTRKKCISFVINDLQNKSVILEDNFYLSNT